MSLTLPASRQVIKCFRSELWLGVRIPQSQPKEIRHCSGLLGRASWAGEISSGRPSLHTASEVLVIDYRAWRL